MTKGIDSLIHGVVKKLKDINSDWKDWGIGKSVRLAASLVTFGLEKLAIKISQTNNTHLSGTTVYDINQALLEPGSNTNADFVHSQNQTKINKNYDEFLERTKQSFEQCASIFVKEVSLDELMGASLNHAAFMKILKKFMKPIIENKLVLSAQLLKAYDRLLYIDAI